MLIIAFNFRYSVYKTRYYNKLLKYKQNHQKLLTPTRIVTFFTFIHNVDKHNYMYWNDILPALTVDADKTNIDTNITANTFNSIVSYNRL